MFSVNLSRTCVVKEQLNKGWLMEEFMKALKEVGATNIDLEIERLERNES